MGGGGGEEEGGRPRNHTHPFFFSFFLPEGKTVASFVCLFSLLLTEFCFVFCFCFPTCWPWDRHCNLIKSSVTLTSVTSE